MARCLVSVRHLVVSSGIQVTKSKEATWGFLLYSLVTKARDCQVFSTGEKLRQRSGGFPKSKGTPRYAITKGKCKIVSTTPSPLKFKDF